MSGTQELLVEVDRLVAELDDADPPTLLDVRWRLVGPPGQADYLAGHLPGAVFVDLDTALCGAPGAAGRHPLPDPAALQAALRA
ncbi:sulfurtransferase, partial [Micromonospora sp. STR1s_6]|nr:sulfurtransferase [Micromonospora tarensis]